jgi:hypothetical protein
MGQLGFCGNCCMVQSLVGFVFFFYITLICLFSPDRLHILKHSSKEEDNQLYSTAWSTSATCTFLYLLIGAGLFIYKFYDQEDRQRMYDWLNEKKEEKKEDYELVDYNDKSH